MLEAALLVLLFLILPGLSGYICHVLESPSKRAWYGQVRYWQAFEYSRALFLSGTALFYLLGAFAWFGSKPTHATAMTLFALICISALVYLWLFADMTAKVIRCLPILKFFFGILAICVAATSKVYSDAAIAELAKLPPQDLPGAQVFLTFVLTPILWALAGTLLMGYVSIPLTMLLFAQSVYLDVSRPKWFHRKRSSSEHIFAGIAVVFFSLLLLTLAQRMLDKDFYERRLRSAIAFASFHLPPSYCGLPDRKGAGVEITESGKAALAIPDEKLGYIFHPVDCSPQQKSRDEVMAELSAR